MVMLCSLIGLSVAMKVGEQQPRGEGKTAHSWRQLLCETDTVVTIAELVSRRGLGLIPVSLPQPWTDVRWVAVSELSDPSPFLEGGEVLLTTGMGLQNRDFDFNDYVARLMEAGVSAIGFAVGLTHADVPPALFAACNAHTMNLFEVPRQTTFVAVSRAVARLLETTEQAAARRALDVQRQLTQAALEEDETTLLGTLAGSLGGAAQVVDADGVGRSQLVGPRGDLVETGEIAREVSRMRRHGLRVAGSVSSPRGTVLVQPIGLRRRPESYLVVAFPGRANDLARAAVMTTVALLSLVSERNRSRRETERRLRGRALEVLLAGDTGTAALLLQGRQADEPARLPPNLAVIRAHGTDEQLEDAIGSLEADIELSALLDGELVAAITPDGVSHVLQILNRFSGLRAGVGEPMSIAELQRSFLAAGHALAAASDTAPVVHWHSALRRGALRLIEPDRARAFAESLLAPLAGDSESQLLETLESFLRHHGSLVRVANDLGVHRNTVRNRVTRIQQALGRSLDDPQARVDVWLALQARASAGQ